MHERFEAPDPVANPWERHSLTERDISETTVDAVMALVLRALADPVRGATEEEAAEEEAAAELTRRINERSLLHQADQVLRKLVSRKIAKCKCEGGKTGKQLEATARWLNARRLELLEQIRRGDVRVPDAVLTNLTKLSSSDDNPTNKDEALTGLRNFLASQFDEESSR
ncbi:PREDICTED: uncharacterized protein LOC106821038 [Priapulus caudatus]|uniref:Uncharacterized protein LOC106821038 n=1 Tax=Priapulus caudatus TaxID=37621 RepID=A0ABM1F9N8_PRICU|nr:PREDICTED: uncharacterized protein LOC106821038 [Priapulus caudatus]